MGLGAAAGFALNQLALTAAGEINPAGPTIALWANKPVFPVTLYYVCISKPPLRSSSVCRFCIFWSNYML